MELSVLWIVVVVTSPNRFVVVYFILCCLGWFTVNLKTAYARPQFYSRTLATTQQQHYFTSIPYRRAHEFRNFSFVSFATLVPLRLPYCWCWAFNADPKNVIIPTKPMRFWFIIILRAMSEGVVLRMSDRKTVEANRNITARHCGRVLSCERFFPVLFFVCVRAPH